MSRIYILLPVHNRIDFTRRFMECLIRQTRRDFRLILLDDGSTDGTYQMVESMMPDAVILRNPRGDWWWSGAMQQGYQWLKNHRDTAYGGYVLMINDDVVFADDYLERGFRLMQQANRTLILSACYDIDTHEPIDLGGRIDWRKMRLYRQFHHLSMNHTGSRVNCLSARGLWIGVDDFIDLGGFHPWRLPHYRADFEFSIRAYHRGYRLSCSDQIRVWTERTPSGFWGFRGDTPTEKIRTYFSNKSHSNPLTRFNFIKLACPKPRWRMRQYYYIIRDSAAEFHKTFFAGMEG